MAEIYFDSSDFMKKFNNIAKVVIPALAEKGVGRAALQLLNDCVMQSPTVPIREGWLRGSGSVFVQNRLAAVSQFGKPGKQNTEYSESIPLGAITAVVGFNAPYAARLHEGVDFHFTEPSAGPKYLESKLISNQDVYMDIVANTIKEGNK